MKLRTVFQVACIAFLLCSCGDSNPFIGGTWQAQVKTGNKQFDSAMQDIAGAAEQSVTFTKNEMIITRGSTEQRLKIAYRNNNDKSWSISGNEGKTWEKIEFIDKDTFAQDNPFGGKIIFKKVK